MCRFVAKADAEGRKAQRATELDGDDGDEFDPYELLGLKRDANAAEIKSAYRKLARLRRHPSMKLLHVQLRK